MVVELNTFGALELRRDGVDVRSVLSQPKRLALLIQIALGSPSGYVGRDVLIGRFWPESDDERARNALRQALHHLRRSLVDGVLTSRGEREVGIEPGVLRCDALAFERALAQDRPEEALALYRGEFLPGFFLDDAPDVERWIEERRSHYRVQALGAAASLVARETERGAPRAAVLWARRCVALDPLDESMTRRLMALLGELGETAAALEVFHQLEARLDGELELAPARETVELAATLRQAASGPSDAAPLDDAAPAAAAPAPAARPDPVGPGRPPPLAAAHPMRRRGDARRALVRRRGLALALVLAVVGVGAVGASRMLARGAPAVPAAPASVAVLPFLNLTGDAANEYFADGVSEELLNVLARVPNLKVAARTSSFAFKGKYAAIDSIAHALGVTHVLEGSVRAAGARVRITAQLIEAGSGFHLWSETYDRPASDIFEVQDEISRAIAKALELELAERLGTAPPRDETADAEAHRLVLRAMQVSRRPSPAAYAEAAALAEEAIRRDTTYARAYAWLAHVLSWQAAFGYVAPGPAYERARVLAERALALRPVTEAHLVLARVAETQDWDVAVTEGHYRRAAELSPADSRPLQYRALFLSRTGRHDEAVATARRATELDPLSQGAFNNLAIVLRAADLDDDAVAAYRAALLLSPDDPVILSNLAPLLAELGRHDEAAAAIGRAAARAPDDLSIVGRQAYLYARAGRVAEARAAFDRLEATPSFPRFNLAVLLSTMYAGANDAAAADRILGLLEAAADRREDGIAGLRSPDMFPQLRDHPRMIALLRRIGGA